MIAWQVFLFATGAGVVFSQTLREKENFSKRLHQFNREYIRMSWLQQSADFTYTTNQTEFHAQSKGYVEAYFSEWMRDWKLWARTINTSDLRPDLGRAILLISNGVTFWDSKEANLASDIRSKMAMAYSSSEVLLPKINVKAKGEDEVAQLIAATKNPYLLEKMWISWRTELGFKVKPLFSQLVTLMNKASRDSGYSDTGAAWRQEAGFSDVVSTGLQLWSDVEGFYGALHGYVRKKLFLFYGGEHIDETGPLPAHLLGSIWGDNWDSLFDILIPYPESGLEDLNSVFRSRNFSVLEMLLLAENFYTELGLEVMTDTFWKKSMFTKPNDGRLVDCHSAAYDFSVADDYRVRMCAEVQERDFYRAIHEMGHVEYYMLYRSQPMVFRGGANSAFHEAVGETMVYAAKSPQCLKKLHLVDSAPNSYETSINLLMKQALSKIAPIPWSLIIDLWRYQVFSGEIDPQNMTESWWKLRRRFQGVKPPNGSAKDLFDPGSKYHVVNSMPYIRYYFSRFLEHQFHESLCKLSGENDRGELHMCCFLGCLKAGNRFRQMLSSGASRNWPDTMQLLNFGRDISAHPLLKYYKPLYDWLRNYNKNNNVSIGW